MPSIHGHSISLPLHGPDLPWPRVGGVERVPVAVYRLAFREDSGADSVHKRIHVDGYEVVLLNQDALDLLDQALAFSQVEAGLMFGPQRLDLRLPADVGPAAPNPVITTLYLSA